MGEDVLEHIETREQQIVEERNQVQFNKDLNYLKLCHKADKVCDKYGSTVVQKWSSMAEIVTFLRPLKRDGDRALPKRRKLLEERFIELKGRQRQIVNMSNELRSAFRKWVSDNETSQGNNI